ncbi:uncharacterized protein SOCE26_061180 [Sorangium cellulosum]|uniref:Secreted protein n=1 Tax=Sorangium cellulosum TaxID=56 RepID=A0A2L0EZC0_SORCE|nr:hypothetical protein [Sorangium cellulosum]AUX44652.1 uncharacterized protein SOCE26_061180 [Sorangium cellulosum]
MRRLAALAALALTLCACAGSALPSAPRCFTGPVPRVGRPVRDEMFALTRRERERAERAPPLVRARILEALPALFPSVGDLASAPRCDAELQDENAAALRAEPLGFSRLLVARLRTVHDLRLLLPLVTRSEESITPYQSGPDEPGPPPPRSLVRHLALAGIPAAWAVNNDPEARRLVLDRLRASGDARELILVHGGAAALFREALRGDPARAQGGEGPSLLRAWLPDLARRLAGPADRASLELVLLRLADLGTYAARLGAGPEARALVDDLLARRGELPIAQGIPGAARDLAEVARGALHDLEAPQPSVSEAALPPPRRDPFSVWRDWLDAEPAGGKVPAADALARVRDLDGELASLRFYAPRCRVIEELGQWLPPDEASRRFDALVAPAFDGEHIRVSTETLCRLGVALRLGGVDEARRVKLLLRLLSAAPEQIGARDRSGDERGPAMGWPADEEPVGEVAARALARNLGWVERHVDLRAWLAQAAAAPVPSGRAAAARWSALQPAFERVIAWHTSGAPDARPETAAAILRAWMESLRAGKVAEGATHLHGVEVANVRVRALGEHGRRAGLAEEIGAFLAERQGARSAVIAAYLLSL